MGFEVRYLSGDYKEDQQALRDLFDELNRGIKNTHVAGDAALELTKLNMVNVGLLDFSATTERPIRHGLDVTPVLVSIVPQTDMRVWESSRRDTDNVYITTSAAGKIWLVVGA